MDIVYLVTLSHKLNLKQVKIAIIICQTSNQSATMEQTTVVQSLFSNCRGINVDTGLSATVL